MYKLTFSASRMHCRKPVAIVVGVVSACVFAVIGSPSMAQTINLTYNWQSGSQAIPFMNVQDNEQDYVYVSTSGASGTLSLVSGVTQSLVSFGNVSAQVASTSSTSQPFSVSSPLTLTVSGQTPLQTSYLVGGTAAGSEFFTSIVGQPHSFTYNLAGGTLLITQNAFSGNNPMGAATVPLTESFTYTATAAPEPNTLALFLPLGLPVAFGIVRRLNKSLASV